MTRIQPNFTLSAQACLMTVGKRHHTVPLLLLRRFSSSPTANAPPLWKLDTESGRRWETNARIETVIDHYYRLEDASLPLAPGVVEDLLSRIESDAAEPVRRLVLGASLITGTALTPREREMMAIFLHVQRQRTPTARAWLAFLDEQMQTEFVKLRLNDLQSTTAFLIAEGDPRTDEEIEAWRAETLAALESGEIGFESGHTREVGLIFFFVFFRAYFLLLGARLAPALGVPRKRRNRPFQAGFEFRLAPDPPLRKGSFTLQGTPV
jgi:hypothetical protein